ncbi:MAG: Smr/MutS family protein [Bacteroidia bacterium]|nr:Smr/MutS family protein [Bacteroidia bacterium]
MDFKEILERWEASSEGKKAVGDNRFSLIIKEKEEGLSETRTKKSGYKSGKASLGNLKAKKPQEVLDLHGYTSDEAALILEDFLQQSVKKRLEKVSVIHGRGLHSLDGKPIVKEVVQKVLSSNPLVRLFGYHPPSEGGDGATWVILQKGG